MSPVTGLFFPVLLLNQRWSPPLRIPASHCSTFRIMCDVPRITVFCSESIECFPGTVSKFFHKLLVTIPVAPIITGTIVHFRFHICYISIIVSLYIIIIIIIIFIKASKFEAEGEVRVSEISVYFYHITECLFADESGLCFLPLHSKNLKFLHGGSKPMEGN